MGHALQVGARAESSSVHRILLIERDAANAELIQAAPADKLRTFSVEWVGQLAAGVERLKQGEQDAVVLDLMLPDCQGIAAFEQVSQASPHVPILIVCDPADESLAMQAVKHGAQDYLLRTHLDSYTLRRALSVMIERNAAADALFIEKERAHVTLDAIGDAVISTDIAGHVTYLNGVAEILTGWSLREAADRPLTEVFPVIDSATREPVRSAMARSAPENKPVGVPAHRLLIRRDGSETAVEHSAAPIHDRRGAVIGTVIVFHDISASRAMSLQMAHSANHDALTGLPNRLLLNDRLTHAIELARRHGRRLAVLFLDMDRFKHINDSLGHPLGDQLLRSVADRLMKCVRSSDTLSRQGGDEFVVVLSEIEQATNAVVSMNKILAAIAEPHRVAGHELHITASIGVSVYPDDGNDAPTLLRNADSALYHAKEQGRACYQFFRSDMNLRAVERQAIEHGLHQAIERQEFVLHYQPKIDLRNRAMIGVEALVRWRHPDRGLLAPKQFVSIAEDAGLIVPMGQWVLREACRQAWEWQDAGMRPLPVAVNVSAIEFRSPGFLDGVCSSLEDTRLDARYLELELTESALMASGESTVSLLRDLKAIGVQLALDDFGTGYSSLSYLKEFPIDVLKVDESFVREISDDLRSASIVRAILSMGKSLNQRVIAEGVETAEQCALLRAQGCREGQGFFFSRPLAAEQFGKLLASS